MVSGQGAIIWVCTSRSKWIYRSGVIIYFFFSSRRRHTRWTGDWSSERVLFRSLPIAAALGRADDARRLLPGADAQSRHLALTLAADYGHVDVVRLLLDAGEDPNRYNPVGGHSHTTPLHQAAGAGHAEVVRLLVERGARLDLKDILWQATPAGWAKHAGRTEIEGYLRQQESANAERRKKS